MAPTSRPADRPDPFAVARTLPRRVARRLRTLVRPAGAGPQWQHRRLEGTDQRWTMIAAELSGDDRSLLDVGCNAGLLAARAAESGLIAVGIDANRDAVRSARRTFAERPRLAFMVHRLDAGDLARLPRFDVVLLLSVYHQWVAEHGNGTAERMLADVAAATRRLLLFETAGVARKYGEHVPRRLAESGAVDYVTDLFRRLAPDASVRHLGPTPTPDDDEEVRHLFAVDVGADPDRRGRS